MIPNKLTQGDEIRVIAPSRSMKLLTKEGVDTAKAKLESLGFKVTFGKNVNEVDEVISSPIEKRVEDLHEAFADKNVKAILTVIGGFNSNQLLKYIDYNLIKNDPKIFCGFSDITALSNAIYAKTGLVTYSGVHFSSFGMQKGFEYSLEHFQKMFLESDEIEIKSSKEWSNDLWFLDQGNRKFIPNEGMIVIHEGEATGEIVGGNLCTLNLLQGTEYMPSIENKILFLEDDEMEGELFDLNFDRNLQSLIHLPKFETVKGIVLGRAELVCKMTTEKWTRIIKTKKELNHIPVIANADFGHTTPIFTFPVGGTAKLSARAGKIQLSIKG